MLKRRARSICGFPSFATHNELSNASRSGSQPCECWHFPRSNNFTVSKGPYSEDPREINLARGFQDAWVGRD